MRIAIVGAGNVGRTLGAALQKKGHGVVYGRRDPFSADDPKAKTVSAALQHAQIVILAVPWSAAESVVCEHAEEMAGKIVIDATNPLAPDLTLAVGHDTSGAEMLQSHARKAKFYKAFNSVGVEAMAKPRFPQGTAAMFVAGPDGPDKDIVLRLVADIGFEPVDAGELNIARLLEPLAMLWIQLALNRGRGRDFAFMLARRDVANRKNEERVRVAYAEPEVE